MKNISKKPLSDRLLRLLDRFDNVPVLVVGDLMIDRSIRGTVDRLSPEAPVPVVDVREIHQSPGGAGNVVCNLAALGARPTLVSVRGDDHDGEQFEMEFRRRNISVSGILVDQERPTITKTRVVAGIQQVVRFDRERRGHLSRQIHGQILDRLKELIPAHKGVLLSDYGKGVITVPVIRSAIRIARRHGAPVTVDPKIEHFMQYRGVDCLTPNTKEATEGMRALPPKTEQEFADLGWKILRRLRSETLLITRGEKGMALFHKNGSLRLIPALAREVFDVTGAGDTVVSVFTLCRALGAPHFESAYLANLAASLVVAKLGTAVCTRDELVRLVRSH